jgi:hypothetical protein
VATQRGLIAKLPNHVPRKFNAHLAHRKIHLYNFATVLVMPRTSSRFFSQALIIERAAVSASLRVPETVLSFGSVVPGKRIATRHRSRAIPIRIA